MNKLTAFMASLENDILIPRLREWLSVRVPKEEKNGSLRAKGVREDARLSVNTFRERLREYNHDDPETKDYFHPSQIGGCIRAIAYSVYGAPRNASTTGTELLRTHLTFEIGTYFHVLFQNLCERAGVLVRREIAVRDDERKIIGHADGVLKINGQKMLLEIKTINSRGFGALRAPKPEHIEQATLYMGILNLSLVVFIYYNKDTAELKEFRVPFSGALFLTLLKRIAHFHSCIRKRILPSKDGKIPGQGPCYYCPYSRVCHDSTEAKKYLASAKLKNIP